MEKIKIGAWGNASAIRLSKTVMAALDAKNGEQLNVVIKGHQVILEKASEAEDELTFDELFKDYNGEIFQSTPHEFRPVGNEKW